LHLLEEVWFEPSEKVTVNNMYQMEERLLKHRTLQGGSDGDIQKMYIQIKALWKEIPKIIKEKHGTGYYYDSILEGRYRTRWGRMDMALNEIEKTVSKIENKADASIENWGLGMDYSGEVSNIWNAAVSAHTENYYVIKNGGWNQDIEAGKSVEFGISGQENFNGFPEGYQLIGQLNDVKDDAYDIDYAVSSDWGSGFTADISIKNNTDSTLEDWVLEFDFDREITEIWNGTIESHENKHYVIKNAGHNANIPKNNSISFGFKGKDGSKSDVPKNYELKSYELKSRQEYMGDSFELDTDGDGLPDGVETKLGLDYQKADTDGDGLDDYDDVFLGFSPLL